MLSKILWKQTTTILPVSVIDSEINSVVVLVVL